jgi:hypothetical protein
VDTLRSLEGLGVIGLFYIGILWLALSYWALKDARSRSDSSSFHLFALAINLFFPLLGFFVYLLVRPSTTLAEQRSLELEAELLATPEPTLDTRPCPACGRQIESEYILCPYCHTRFAKRCPTCAHAVRLGWTLCPYCAAPLDASAVPRVASQG